MSDMIERVAKGISDKSQVRAYGRVMTPWRDPSMANTYIENRLDEARGAIEVMREPTLEMLKAMWRRNDDNDAERATLENWQEAIDAALGQPTQVRE